MCILKYAEAVYIWPSIHLALKNKIVDFNLKKLTIILLFNKQNFLAVYESSIVTSCFYVFKHVFYQFAGEKTVGVTTSDE